MRGSERTCSDDGAGKAGSSLLPSGDDRTNDVASDIESGKRFGRTAFCRRLTALVEHEEDRFDLRARWQLGQVPWPTALVCLDQSPMNVHHSEATTRVPQLCPRRSAGVS